MTIERLSSGDPYEQSLDNIDNNTWELNGKISQAKFSKNELDSIYDDTGISRRYKILSGAGHSLSTYTNWTHVKEESGYSIWSIPFTNFKDNSLNEMYLDDVVLTYKGEADQVAYTTFTYVYLYDGSTYINNTTEAGTEVGTAFSLMDATDEYLYLGSSSIFSASDFNFNIRGSNYTLKVEYYNSAWTELTLNLNDLLDNTRNFKSNGRLEYTLPTDWLKTSVNSLDAYWIRISTTTTPVTTATAYSILPGNSVYSLLQLSSINVLNEEFSWCYFNDNVYVTIRNTGNSVYEGNTYLSSSSSSTNKQNFFVYNHEYKVSYEQSGYTSGSAFARFGFNWYATGSGTNSGFRFLNYGATNLMTLDNSKSTNLALRVETGVNDFVTGASTGSGGAVPAQIAKYLAISINGTTYKIPLFNS